MDISNIISNDENITLEINDTLNKFNNIEDQTIKDEIVKNSLETNIKYKYAVKIIVKAIQDKCKILEEQIMKMSKELNKNENSNSNEDSNSNNPDKIDDELINQEKSSIDQSDEIIDDFKKSLEEK